MSVLWLLIATVLSLFSMGVGKWIILKTARLGASFYIRLFRTQRRIWLAYLLTAFSTGIVAAVMPAISLAG